MKKIIYCLFLTAALITSCSSSDDFEVTTPDGFATTPVSGVIYDESFVIGGGTSRAIELNGTSSLYIYLDANVIGCDSEVESPIWISVPATVGTYSRSQGEMTLQFRDVNSDDFEGSLDAEIEIISITETTVKGKVKATGFYEDENNINGTFEVIYCSL
ncbi:hypothetical protein DVK85_03295 [Flavobacterium arcticum]|uniref:DUF4402 domain-containing protein n=1 Tax=Flavobacterium arcticum TaxID=1784713 RepID=A0A345H9P5_9FLAO|nr:hypothetical protein [Flavobacterium arcticum]AXG73305.1 hypothetical protein DVK85_03295 [Flavobacterium arcticum]KAF2513100.1 hypothetical protein E0W72_01360 [Flavobacterium arcticum]